MHRTCAAQRGSAMHTRDDSNGSNGSGRKPSATPERLKTYHEGQPFPGHIGRTWDVSEPAFPVPPTAPPGAPNILYVVLDDVGFGWSDTFGGLVETPNITRLAEERPEVRQLPHDGALLADARVPAHRPESPLGRNGKHHRARERVSPATTAGSRMDKAAIASMLHEHGYTSFALGKWHNTPSEETGVQRALRSLAHFGRVFGFDRFYGFFGGDNSQWYPKLYPRSRADRSAALARGGLSPLGGPHRQGDRPSSPITRPSAPDKPWL